MTNVFFIFLFNDFLLLHFFLGFWSQPSVSQSTVASFYCNIVTLTDIALFILTLRADFCSLLHTRLNLKIFHSCYIYYSRTFNISTLIYYHLFVQTWINYSSSRHNYVNKTSWRRLLQKSISFGVHYSQNNAVSVAYR